jgi:anti-sigma B factor antagonist
MEILSKNTGAGVELTIRGRLDAYWTDLLANELEKVIQAGHHHVRIDLEHINFLSSAGIGVLLKYQKMVRRIGGSLGLVRMSESVRRVLDLSKLTTLLTAPEIAAVDLSASGQLLEHPGADITVFPVAPSQMLTCRLVGDPGRLPEWVFRDQDTCQARFPPTTFGLGLGALGHCFGDCSESFGEFLAAGGAAAYLPTNNPLAPDYLLASAELIPEMEVCYGLVGDGSFAWRAAFAARSPGGTVSLTDLADAALRIAGSDRVGVVVVAEAASLMGAALRRPLTEARPPGGLFAFPQVRDWLAFTAERAFPRSTALVVGVVARDDGGALAPLLRPLGTKSGLSAHFHAAAFSYRPLPKNPADLPAAVWGLFTGHTLQGVLHLLVDDRPLVSAGQSEFFRGSLWVGPLQAEAAGGPS